MHRTRESQDSGFTLIELLVVIIIIGILAAIAIPVYLSQRQKGWDSAAKSDLRSVASYEDGFIVERGTFGSFADLTADGAKLVTSTKVTVTLVAYDAARGYCLSAKHVSSSHTYYYDSNGGGLLPGSATGCTVITSGVAGGTITG